MKSGNKGLIYELEENLKNITEQATRLQKCIAENGTLKSWKLIKQKVIMIIWPKWPKCSF